jgi:hypothetical protein
MLVEDRQDLGWFPLAAAVATPIARAAAGRVATAIKGRPSAPKPPTPFYKEKWFIPAAGAAVVLLMLTLKR